MFISNDELTPRQPDNSPEVIRERQPFLKPSPPAVSTHHVRRD